jgi:hypothetical protein
MYRLSEATIWSTADPNIRGCMLAAIGICPLAAISGYPETASFVTECDYGLLAWPRRKPSRSGQLGGGQDRRRIRRRPCLRAPVVYRICRDEGVPRMTCAPPPDCGGAFTG